MDLNTYLSLVIVNVAYLIGAYDIAILLTYVNTVKKLLKILCADSAVQPGKTV